MMMMATNMINPCVVVSTQQVGSSGLFAIQRRRQNFVISRQWVAQQVDDGQRPLLASSFALASLHTQIVALWFGSAILLFSQLTNVAKMVCFSIG